MLDDSTPVCWGRYIKDVYDLHDEGEPGRNPVAVTGFEGRPKTLLAGENHVCMPTDTQDLWCWGLNRHGQLGVGYVSELMPPTVVADLSSQVVSAACGGAFSCAHTVGGELWCWGADYHGQLGQHHTWQTLPTLVSVLPTAVRSVAAGWAHTCIIDIANDVWCWGFNYAGQVGVELDWDALVPVKVPLPAGEPLEVVGGALHTCARMSNGPLLCWGDNSSGQLGDGQVLQDPIGRATPEPVIGVTAPEAVALGMRHTCALEDGAVWCWGGNEEGQLGNGLLSTDSSDVVSVPTRVEGLPEQVAALAAGRDHTCAATADGVWCWGLNDNGQASPQSREKFVVTPTRVPLAGPKQ